MEASHTHLRNDSDASIQPNSSAGVTDEQEKRGKKRTKYAVKACHTCKRRKVKCTGEDPCHQCRTRDIRCRYTSPANSPLPAGGASGEIAQSHSRASSRTSINPLEQSAMPLSITSARTTLVDSPDNCLNDRVSALERMMTHVVKSAILMKGSPSGGNTLPILIQPNMPDGHDDSRQFDVRAAPYDSLALSSQVAAMSALLSRPPTPPNNRGLLESDLEVLIELPEPRCLQHLLNIYFRDMDNYFPFLDREEIEPQILETVHQLGYSSHNRILVVTLKNLALFALACIMLALADCLNSDNGASDGETTPGWESYVQSCRALQHLANSKVLNLHVVRAQCLVAAYLMQCETLTAASKAVFATWQLATSIRLNNKKKWPSSDSKGSLQRQQLWWTIYFLDRQISRRSGTAYHIRDTEFDVDDFDPKGRLTERYSTVANVWYSSISASYLHVLISLARLWGTVWDTFFAVGASKKGDWMEVEIMDARILNTRRQLPSLLTWNSDELMTYIRNGEDGLHIRRRLQIYTRLELLRMLIRQNPVCQAVFNSETSHFCARLSREIIRAHDLYISHYPEARAIGYFTTSSTVECIYHLALVMHDSKDQDEHAACVSAFGQAHGILVKLSSYNKVAKRALKALNSIVRRWGGGTSNSTSDAARDNLRQPGAVDRITTDSNLQISGFQESSMQNGSDSFGNDFGEWMNVNMDSLLGHEFDALPELQI